MRDLASIRREYTQSHLTTDSVSPDPMVQFAKWVDDAVGAQLVDPNAATLSTVSKQGVPSSRVVLLKGIADKQFIFYTNYQSRKGKELRDNPMCALNFFWVALERQVSIKGVAERADPKISDRYFMTRPRASQIGAWVSPQSVVIQNRKILEERLDDIEERYADSKAIPRPKQWGGYQVTPYEIEFWQGRPGRLHDRIAYNRSEDGWAISRLAP